MRPMRILLVCRGNLCRSPMALAIATRLMQQMQPQPRVRLDSAGTHAAGRSRPDARALAALAQHGYAAPRMRARPVLDADFVQQDQILAMDLDNLAELQRRCPPAHRHKLHLFLAFADGLTQHEVPDPYFGAQQGFELVLALCEAGARGLLAHWSRALKAPQP